MTNTIVATITILPKYHLWGVKVDAGKNHKYTLMGRLGGSSDAPSPAMRLAEPAFAAIMKSLCPPGPLDTNQGLVIRTSWPREFTEIVEGDRFKKSNLSKFFSARIKRISRDTPDADTLRLHAKRFVGLGRKTACSIVQNAIIEGDIDANT